MHRMDCTTYNNFNTQRLDRIRQEIGSSNGKYKMTGINYKFLQVLAGTECYETDGAIKALQERSATNLVVQ